MIVIGADTHKQTHTCGAVFAASGRLVGELTAPAREPGFRELLAWGRALESERIWAIEDCRHVSGSLERFLVASGERVVRVPPKLMGESRRGERTAGKSDAIDAPASPAPPRSPPPRASASAAASTAAATDSSTAPCTASRSPRAASILQRAITSPASRPRASHEARRCAASNGTLPAASGLT